jgi:hypothetical protein
VGSVTMKHELSCDAETYFEKCVFVEEYNKRLHLDVLKFPGFKLLEQKTEGDVWTRRAQIEPPTTGIPGPLKKAIGEKLSYIEEGSYDRKTKVYTFKVISSTMPDKTRINGEMRFEPTRTSDTGAKTSTRIAKIDVEVKVFMIGGLAEDKILSDIKQSYDAGGKFANEDIKEKGY